jgi:hypothetical protein
MDEKEKQLVVNYHDKIINKEFDESDIYIFLMLLREKFDNKTPLRELGDFIAHREKNRGYIYDYLLDNKRKLDDVHNKTVPPEGRLIESKEVFTIKQIKDQYNRYFKEWGLTLFSTSMVNDIVLCVMSLFQNIAIQNRHKQEIGVLRFGISQKDIVLNGLVEIKNAANVKASFPVMMVPNIYCKCEPIDEYGSWRNIDGIVEIIKINNALEIFVKSD